MIGFVETFIDLRVPKSGDIRYTLSKLTYFPKVAKGIIEVDVHLATDLGSIPQALQSLFPKDGKAMFAYILHDDLYKRGLYSRSTTDDVLEEAMKTLGVTWWRRKAIREGLRVGGWVAWNKHRKKD